MFTVTVVSRPAQFELGCWIDIVAALVALSAGSEWHDPPHCIERISSPSPPDFADVIGVRDAENMRSASTAMSLIRNLLTSVDKRCSDAKAAND